MTFDSTGRLVSVDGGKKEVYDAEAESEVEKTYEIDVGNWSLKHDGGDLRPLKFTNGKTQEEIVKEVVELVKNGNRMIFIHGTCGTGKSAIALNIARELGKTSIVVPVKGLQKQYEEDYQHKKFVVKKDGKRMRIAMITGRQNHDSVFIPGKSCDDPLLPETIPLIEKNHDKIKEYYNKNPLTKENALPKVRTLRRMAVAPANPYWSPIMPAQLDVRLDGARKKKYRGLNGKEFIFYHRKEGCGYYDQYQAYIDADVLIFNSAKYKIESLLDRKPATEVDIIDEADEFLDSFSSQEELNLTRLGNSLRKMATENPDLEEVIENISEMIEIEEKTRRALGIDERKIFKADETQMGKLLKAFLKNRELEFEILVDEMNYANKAVEIAKDFAGLLEESYVSFRKREDNLIMEIATSNISSKFREIAGKNKVMIFMSGTIHSENVLKHIFGIKDFKVVEAEGVLPGSVEIHMTGKEMDFKHSNLKGDGMREIYLKALAACIERAKNPTLVHVNAFEDLPNEEERVEYELKDLMSRERLIAVQSDDKTGRMISMFKKKMVPVLYSTKCSRGVDFPGEICNSIIFTKYPNPNIQDIFWKILQQSHREYYWEFYKDKARREFLQRVYRAVRFPEDHVYVLSPDIRVLDAIKKMQMNSPSAKV